MTLDTLQKANLYNGYICMCDRIILILSNEFTSARLTDGTLDAYISGCLRTECVDYFKRKKAEYERKLEELQ